MRFFKKKDKKSKRNKDERLTFIVIPDTSKKPKKLSVSKRTVSTAFGALGLFVLCFFILGYAYYYTQEEIQQVHALRQETQQKEEVIKHLGEEINEINKIKDRIDKKQDEIRKLMGLEEEREKSETASRGGQGGREDNTLSFEVDELEQIERIKLELSFREKELEQYYATVKDDEDYFRAIPNYWPAEGDISSPFGWRTSPFGGSAKQFHNGIDIANVPGTDIVAAGDGVVTHSGWLASYGYTVLIDHGYGFVTKYAHNSSLHTNVGDKVEKGDLIAKMGSTGRSTGPHLHFSIFKWDEPKDPLIYLP
ncbi:metalloendopeptidase [Candidatus Syntrophocurvum alkaliphilum]|uniref:Metalloendopeptidase n=1 Tax=Candidatus Syntrophocurvum alkaliphilum TaxID=2293317 RepID=A0A6I6DIA6_9FIRM|nr:M23 family metallopeptidase [Candidatus Syntrophocurvum alkaliphilum]QGU00624.1 metalloendopeptidase [Candidatus Syntrophocurvum alkaliphilum]